MHKSKILVWGYNQKKGWEPLFKATLSRFLEGVPYKFLNELMNEFNFKLTQTQIELQT